MKLLSPIGFLVAAAAIAAAYGLAHLAGLRDSLAVVSGAPGPIAPALVYMALHFLFVLAVPPLVAAAGLLLALRALARRRV